MLHLIGSIVAADNGTITTAFLNDLTDVPASAQKTGGLAVSPAGALYVCAHTDPGNYSYVKNHGLRIREDGALCVDTVAGNIETRLGSVAVTEDGDVVVEEAGTPDLRVHGIGVTEAGIVIVTDAA